MPTLRERAPYLFETRPLDAEGRQADRPPTPAPAAKPVVAPPAPTPRVPSPVEVVNFVFTQHHINPDNAAAADIVASLAELSKPVPVTPPAARPAPTPVTPAPMPASAPHVSPPASPVPPKTA